MVHALLRLHGLRRGSRLRGLLRLVQLGEVEQWYMNLSWWHRALALGYMCCFAMRVHTIVGMRTIINTTLYRGRMIVLLTHLLKAGVHAATVVIAGAWPLKLMTVAHMTQVVASRLITPFATLD